MKNKKNDRTENKRILSVEPVTSRESPGSTARQLYPRGIMKQRVAILLRRIERDGKEIKRLNAAIAVLDNK